MSIEAVTIANREEVKTQLSKHIGHQNIRVLILLVWITGLMTNASSECKFRNTIEPFLSNFHCWFIESGMILLLTACTSGPLLRGILSRRPLFPFLRNWVWPRRIFTTALFTYRCCLNISLRHNWCLFTIRVTVIKTSLYFLSLLLRATILLGRNKLSV